MKRFCLLISIIWISLTVVAVAQEPDAEKPVSPYAAVTDVLDPEGDFFLYLSAAETNRLLQDRYPALKAMMMDAARRQGPAKEAETTRILKGAEAFISGSGLNDVRAVGASSVKLEPRMYRSRIFVYHGPDAAKGKLWDLLAGDGSQPIPALALMPQKTALAAVGDFDFGLAWDLLRQLVLSFGDQKAQEQFQGGLALAKLQGLDLEALIKSVDRQQGFAVTLDENNMVTVPIDKQPMDIPEPAALVFAKVKDDAILTTIKKLLVEKKVPFVTERPGPESVVYSMPAIAPALPFPFVPTIAAHKKWLIIGSNPELVKTAIACEQGKQKGLPASDTFRKYTRELPKTGNQLLYVAPPAPEYFIAAVEQSLVKKEGEEHTKQIFKLLGLDGPAPYGALVLQRRSDGVLITMNSNLMLSQTALISSVAIPAMTASAAAKKARNQAPAAAPAVQRRTNNTRKLQQIGLGLMLYANDHNGKFPSPDGAAGLQKLVAKGILSEASAYLHPEDARRTSAEPLKTLTEGRCSYAYLGAGFTDADPDADVTPVCFDKPGLGDGVTVLYVDGHVESFEGNFPTRASVIQLLKHQRKIPEKRFQTLLKKAKALDQAAE